MNQVWAILFYDDEPFGKKQLWEICATEQVAEQVKAHLEKTHPDYEFEIESYTITQAFNPSDYDDDE